MNPGMMKTGEVMTKKKKDKVWKIPTRKNTSHLPSKLKNRVIKPAPPKERTTD